MKHPHSALTTTLMLAAIASFSHPIYAQQAQTPREDPIALYREAGIDQGQEKRILGLVNAYEKEEDVKAHKQIALLNRLRALSTVANLNEKLILETQEGINNLQSDMAMDKIHLLINIRRVLNIDQKARLVALMLKRNGQSSSSQ